MRSKFILKFNEKQDGCSKIWTFLWKKQLYSRLCLWMQ